MPRNAIYIWCVFPITTKFLQIQKSYNFVRTSATKVYGGHEVIFHKLYISTYMEVNWQFHTPWWVSPWSDLHVAVHTKISHH
jgi:hypothetical protein